MTYIAYCDGSCLVHASKCGGWAVRMESSTGSVWYDHGHVCRTTNNAMELTAVYNAIDMVPPGADLCVYTDSEWVAGALGFHAFWTAPWRIKHNVELVERTKRLAASRRLNMVCCPRRSTPGLCAVDDLAHHESNECHAVEGGNID